MRAILEELDPEGLMRLGAPPGEYDAEASELVRFVLGAEEPTPAQIVTYWKGRFGPRHEMTRERAEGLARELAQRRDA